MVPYADIASLAQDITQPCNIRTGRRSWKVNGERTDDRGFIVIVSSASGCLCLQCDHQTPWSLFVKHKTSFLQKTSCLDLTVLTFLDLALWLSNSGPRRQADPSQAPSLSPNSRLTVLFSYSRISDCYLDLIVLTSLNLEIWLRNSGTPRRAIPSPFSLSSNCRFTDPFLYSRTSCCQCPPASIEGGNQPYVSPYILRSKNILPRRKHIAGTPWQWRDPRVSNPFNLWLQFFVQPATTINSGLLLS